VNYTGEAVVQARIFPKCENEGQFAALLSFRLAPVLARHREESLSTKSILKAGVIPAASFLLTPYFLPGLLFLSIHYILGYGSMLKSWKQRDSLFQKEDMYISLRLMHQAGYDVQDSVRYWRKNFEGIGKTNSMLWSAVDTLSQAVGDQRYRMK
jgi:hypothetical protein